MCKNNNILSKNSRTIYIVNYCVTCSTLDLAILIGNDCPTASISITTRCLPFIFTNLPTRSFSCPDLILTNSPSLKSMFS